MNQVTAKNAPDTSPAGIAARRRDRAYALQDKARELQSQGVKPMPAAETLGIDRREYQYLANASFRREEIRKVLASGVATPPELTKPETALMSALLDVHLDLLLSASGRGPESKIVSWKARKSSGWATTTARRRLDLADHAMAAKGEEPRLGLTRVAGNGYIGLTDEGWRVCAALWPERMVL